LIKSFPLKESSLQMDDIILSKVGQVQRDKGHMFSLIWKIDPIQVQALLKYTHTHTHTHTHTEHVLKIGTVRGY
jgi:hypothetical protein